MSRRFLVIALVFAAGFGVGYGATWLIVGSPDKTPPTPAATKPPPEALHAATTPAPATVPAAAPDAAVASVAAEPDAAAPAVEEVALAAADAAESPEDVQVVPTEAPDTAVAAQADVEPNGKPATWWDACQGKVCIVDWGRVSGGISVREGHIEHGSEVDWAESFAKAEKVGTLEAKKGMKVEVIAVGLANGKPIAAEIKWKNTKGVIALSFGEKSISFRPPAD